ncbi:MAG: hypothetical protein NVS9B6_19670 [Candidatus Limnocylindrales bacterium]
MIATIARPTIAMGLLLAGLLLATAFVALAIQRNAMARETAGLQADIIAQQARRARLEAELTEKAGDSYVIDKARDYGYVKPGEAIIGVKQEPKIATTPVIPPAPSRAELWLALFFGAR